MIYFLPAHSFGFLRDLLASTWRSDHEQDRDILFLRQQLHILQRKQVRPPRTFRWEKLTLTTLAVGLRAVGSRAQIRMGLG